MQRPDADTTRRRLVALGRGDVPDRTIYWPEGRWPETLRRWRAEGMTDNHDFGFDLSQARPDVEIGYCPPWETGVIADEGTHYLHRDQYGIVRRSSKDGRSDIAQYVSFPVADRAGWDSVRPRLEADVEGRYAEGWESRAGAAREPLTFGGGHVCGFFSFLRELFGDEEVYLLLYDDPDLVDEIMSFQVQRLSAMLERIFAEVRIDRVFIWEDMCYKNGPLIGPELFRRHFLIPYQRYIGFARGLGIEVFDVDSDGKVDELLPLWVEAGVTMMHPFEVQSGMDVNAVTARYGERLCVCGGIDKRKLARGRDAIDRELERIRPALDTGRYIPCADHSIPPDVPFADYCYYTEQRARMVGAL